MHSASEGTVPPVNIDPNLLIQKLARTQRPRLAAPANMDAATYRTWTSQVREKVFDLLGQAQILPAQPGIAGFQRSVEDGLRRERFFCRPSRVIGRRSSSPCPKGMAPMPPCCVCTGTSPMAKTGSAGPCSPQP